MARILVLATGGTIASTRSSSPGATATESIEALLQTIESKNHLVSGRDVLTTGSYLLTHHHLRIIAETVAQALDDDSVDGVVLTHGTDTLEETAYLLDLVHSSQKPVVLTGAQRTPDSIGHDGQLNLLDAIDVAGSLDSRGLGVLIAFAGEIHPARGTRKIHTTNPSPFGGSGPIGSVIDGKIHYTSCPQRPTPLPLPDSCFDSVRVDVVPLYPGSDAIAAQALTEAGAHGVIILGTGAGNGNHSFCEWTSTAVNSGVVVGLSTRVAAGSVLPLYGNGGATDLIEAGALSLGDLPWTQARILLSLLLSLGNPISPVALAEHI